MSNQETPCRESFVFYRSFYDSIGRLPERAQLALFRAVAEYGLDQVVPDFAGVPQQPFVEAIFAGIRPQLDANHKRFLNGCKGGEFGRLGGAPKGNTNARKGKQPQNNPKTTPNENVNVNENENENVERGTGKTPTRKPSFVKPSLDDVTAYCQERGNGVDPSAFIDFYESNGWMVGKNRMRDWRATVRNWERKHPKPTNTATGQDNGPVITDINDLFKD